ncbi:MAG: osmotically inducible protein OsmC [Bdellovibrionales bacterium RIFOXYC1_FULL_54_43]|nr:MAG: osmotically inducible protein OsmC [Bdellovibrionales bacterium RIFOXYC1_FULL_54_43]OFZ84357.1 MAG: osmotically inducible protein OsmC [Bdellovibrionales bacterium RIFOXYD1_FULL_55_31]
MNENEMRIRFPGNKKVTAEYDGYTVLTDQPVSSGGDGSAPAPFDLFLASLGTCAGIFALSFCKKRNISTDGLELIQRFTYDDEKHLYTKISLEIRLPSDFPEKYKDSIVQAVDLCTVKRHLQNPPAFDVYTTS